mmetsp:Transcript_15184/g.31299  ORF Transcript_15184/g.31299 Transcript_15184/m.31299 type:complete len:246 (-) Transcript_15184:27-764(-)
MVNSGSRSNLLLLLLLLWLFWLTNQLSRTGLRQKGIPLWPIVTATVIKGSMSPDIFSNQELGLQMGQQEFQKGRGHLRSPTQIVQNGTSQIITNIGIHVRLVQQELNGCQIGSTTGQMNQVFALIVAGLERVTLFQHLTQCLNVIGSNGIDHGQCVMIQTRIVVLLGWSGGGGLFFDGRKIEGFQSFRGMGIQVDRDSWTLVCFDQGTGGHDFFARLVGLSLVHGTLHDGCFFVVLLDWFVVLWR